MVCQFAVLAGLIVLVAAIFFARFDRAIGIGLEAEAKIISPFQLGVLDSKNVEISNAAEHIEAVMNIGGFEQVQRFSLKLHNDALFNRLVAVEDGIDRAGYSFAASLNRVTKLPGRQRKLSDFDSRIQPQFVGWGTAGGMQANCSADWRTRIKNWSCRRQWTMINIEIGAQGALLSVTTNAGLLLGGAQSAVSQGNTAKGQQRINANTNSGTLCPTKYLSIMFGALLLGGFVLFCKGVYCDNDFMIWGGWFAAAFGVVGSLIISLGHCSFCAEKASVSSVSSFSAPRYRSLEDVGIHAIIVPELKLSDIQRQIFAADLVEAAHDAALQQRPEAINRLRVNDTINILFLGMADEGMREVFFEMPVAGMLISDEQANIISDGLANETVQGRGISIGDHAGDDIALALDCADNDELASNTGSRLFLVPMTVTVAATDVGFVNLDDAAQLGFRFNKSGADFVAHGMCGAVATEAHHALNLKSADPLLAGQHEMHDLEPLPQWLIRVLKDRPGDMREAIGRHGSTFVALPVEGLPGQRGRISAAARAFDAIRPAPRDQVSLARFLIGEGGFELRNGHLMNWFRAAHGISSQRERNIAWPI